MKEKQINKKQKQKMHKKVIWSNFHLFITLLILQVETCVIPLWKVATHLHSKDLGNICLPYDLKT